MLPTPLYEDDGSIWSRFVPSISLRNRGETVEAPRCSLVLAIDFGTTNSSVAIWRPDKARVKIIKNKRECE